MELQQYLPFTVLKLDDGYCINRADIVATVLTVYGIETCQFPFLGKFQYHRVATVLTVYGIETLLRSLMLKRAVYVATVLTVYGIETIR